MEHPEEGASSAEKDALEAKIDAFRVLEGIIEKLRSPEGCPWDRSQTLKTLAPNLLEEACETIDSIAEGNGASTPGVCEELGDLLMNVLLIARISEEEGGFGFREVAEAISAKLIRRHPHVFAGSPVSSVEEVLKGWNRIKAEEKGGPAPSILGRIPRSLPALAAAAKAGERAAGVGFDWPHAHGALEKVEEEVREVAEALGGSPLDGGNLHHEIGDLLFAVVNVSRKSGVDPEAALRGAVDRFSSRFRYLEARIDVTKATPDAMEALWNRAKADGF